MIPMELKAFIAMLTFWVAATLFIVLLNGERY